VVAALGLQGWAGCSQDDEEESDIPVSEPSSDVAGSHVYDTSRVATLALQVSEEALATLRADAKKPMGTEDFTYVAAQMTFDGVVYEKVGLRVKGNSSRAMASGDAVPFKVDMNRFVDGQRLDGLTKINLHNNHNQPAAMNEYLSYGAFREFGVAASRTGWVDLTLNGVSLGLYTSVEQVNERMLARWYDNGSADLYKPEPPAGSLSNLGEGIDDYTNVGYEADNPTDHATFLRLVATINERDVNEWDAVVDVESVLTYLAGNVALGNWDTYVAMSHNYYLFEGTPGKLVMLPWDMNLSQGATTAACPASLQNSLAPGGLGGGMPPLGGDFPMGGAGSVPPFGDFPVGGAGSVPPLGGDFPSGGAGSVPTLGGPGLGGGAAPLHDRLLADASYLARYLERLSDFLAGPGSVETLNARIDAVVGVLGDRISAEGVSNLRSTIASRVTAVESAVESTQSCPLVGDLAASP
jgi:spore coat protein CotH